VYNISSNYFSAIDTLIRIISGC